MKEPSCLEGTPSISSFFASRIKKTNFNLFTSTRNYSKLPLSSHIQHKSVGSQRERVPPRLSKICKLQNTRHGFIFSFTEVFHSYKLGTPHGIDNEDTRGATEAYDGEQYSNARATNDDVTGERILNSLNWLQTEIGSGLYSVSMCPTVPSLL